jgi:hypothetical protein
MDELTLVRSFRADAPPISDETHNRVRGLVLELADAETAMVAGKPKRRLGLRRSPGVRMRRTIVLAAAAVSLLAAGAAGALTLRALTQQPVTAGFSALADHTLPPPPADVMDGPTGFRALGPGPYEDARTVGEGVYLARRGDALCSFVVHGAGGCTEHLPDGDVWLGGTMGREYDAETAPFQVFLYGFARDNIAMITVTTSNGFTVMLPVKHNAFQTTLPNKTFSDITSVSATSNSGATTQLDISAYNTPMLNPQPVGPQNTIDSQTVDGATFTASWWTAAGNHTCIRLSDGTSASLGCPANSANGMTLAGPTAWPASDGTVTVVYGTVPSHTANAEIDFSDGTAATVPAENGGFLYAAEHTPLPSLDTNGTTVRALDANGNTIATGTTPVVIPLR